MYQLSKDRKEQVYYILLLLVAVLIPTAEAFSIKLASFSVILLSVWWIASGDITQKFYNLKNNRLLWLFAALYLVNLVGLLQHYNVPEANKLLLRKLPILLFPLIIGTSSAITKKQIHGLLVAFTASLLLISLYTFREGWHVLLNRTNITMLVNLVLIHRPYFGLFCAFAVVALFYFIQLRLQPLLVKVAEGILILYFLFFIYLLYAKMIVVALIALPFIIATVVLAKKTKPYWVIIAILVIVCAASYVARTSATLQLVYHKIINAEDFSYQDYDINIVSSINIRYINWGCSYQVLKKDHNWVTGLGIGNVQEKLNACYKNLNPWIYESEMNAHNEYLEETLRNGVTGLVILLLCFLLPTMMSINKGNYLYFSFLVLFSICCITESMLSRQSGILFYSFLNAVLAFSCLSDRENRLRISTEGSFAG
ncbi:O-antigen ligase family protein [Pontibacter chitinilyticus]|uniref:O-antigen ligase family protein n=1 Tax=Pontibacter chitinilyticus TaxID=2674989 RepID=UPI00321AEC59